MSDRDNPPATLNSHSAQTKLETGVPAAHDAEATLDSAPGASARRDLASIGPYHLVKKLGEGGMGQVWLAEQRAPIQRQVALKLIKVGMYDDSVLQRFQSERQSLAIMEHPSIAKVFDAGATPDGQPYFVMEYVPGLPITDYCDQKRMKIGERLELFVKVCEGVQHAHQKAIMHRDLKPANILVVEVDGKPVPRIIDFGLAKAATPQVGGETLFTQVGGWVGTPGYMSPEQADPSVMDVDTRTDVYSLGAVLYVLLTGFVPFESKDWRKQRFDEFLRRLREEDPPRPSTKIGMEKESSVGTAEMRGFQPKQLVNLLHGDLDWITMKALKKDRARRYGTPSELAADITRSLRHELVVARPASAGYRLQKYVRRHRVGVAAAAGLVLLLAGFAVIQAVQLRRITRERDRANRITDFMTNMFKVSDPSEARGNSITAREILDKASKDIDTGLAKDPEVQAQMMDVMGNVYDNLGLYPSAGSLFTRSMAIRRRWLGTRNPNTLATMLDLGWVLEEQGHYEEAEKLVRETLETRRQLLGPKNPDTLKSMIRLAEILEDEGRYPEAEKLARQALAMHRQVMGPEHPNTLAAMDTLAYALGEQGRYSEAETLYRQTLDTGARVLGPEHQLTLNRMGDVAWVVEQEGRYAEAEKLNRQAVDIERRILGPEHPNTLNTMNNLAEAIGQQGSYADAEKLYRETVEIRSRVLGPEHPDTLNSTINLAMALTEQGRNAEAEKLARQTLTIQQRIVGPEHPDTVGSISTLARILANKSRYAEAEKLARQALDLRRRILGPEHRQTLVSMNDLAAILAHQGQFAEAEKSLRATVETQARSLGPEHPDTAESTYKLACVAALRGDRDEAFSLLMKAVDHGLVSGIALGIEKAPDLKSLRSDPRFAALVAHVKERAAAAHTSLICEGAAVAVPPLPNQPRLRIFLTQAHAVAQFGN